MKNTLLTLSLLTLCCAAFAKDKSKPKAIDLTGSWKEVRRIDLRNDAIDYTDTTYYEFLVGNEYTTQRKHSFMYRGTYKVTPGLLDLGMRAYSITEMTADKMILKDDAGSYKFVRYTKTQESTDNSAAASGGRAYKEEVAGGNVTLSQITGKWEVYKRTSSTTLPEIDYTRIVQMIQIGRRGGDTLGVVASAKDMEGQPSWKITRFNDGLLFCTGPKGSRQLKIVSYKPGELIVSEEPVTYFFKQFK